MSDKKKRGRLGRGLSSLIDVPEAEEHPPTSPAVVEREVPTPRPAEETAPPPHEPMADGSAVQVDVNAVSVNPHQPRREFDEQAIGELAASLKSTGLIQPIVVRRTDAGYELIAGERRLRAARKAGLATVAAIVRDVDGFRQAQMALVENVQRENLNPLDRAAAYRTLIDQLGLTQAELADRVGEDRSVVANHLRLLDLAPPVQEHVRSSRLSLGHAKVLAGVQDGATQTALADRAAAEGLSVRNLEKLAADPAPPLEPTNDAPPERPTSSAHLAGLQRRMSQHLGSRVELSEPRKGRGKIVLHYRDLGEFERLSIKLGVDPDED